MNQEASALLTFSRQKNFPNQYYNRSVKIQQLWASYNLRLENFCFRDLIGCTVSLAFVLANSTRFISLLFSNFPPTASTISKPSKAEPILKIFSSKTSSPTWCPISKSVRPKSPSSSIAGSVSGASNSSRISTPTPASGASKPPSVKWVITPGKPPREPPLTTLYTTFSTRRTGREGRPIRWLCCSPTGKATPARAGNCGGRSAG